MAFVNPAKKGDKNFTGITNLFLILRGALPRHANPFYQAGDGWVLQELSRPHPAEVVSLLYHLP